MQAGGQARYRGSESRIRTGKDFDGNDEDWRTYHIVHRPVLSNDSAGRGHPTEFLTPLTHNLSPSLPYSLAGHRLQVS